MTAARLASGIAIATYATITFVALWITAHAYARDPFPDGIGPAASIFVAFVLPLLAGFATGRWWAPALVLWLLLAGSVADGLEPLQRDPTGEVEGSVELVALIIGCIHVPLLLAGAGLRKLVRPRPPGRPWSLT
jgi:hypothetical protein